jgi:hypothetical protein
MELKEALELRKARAHKYLRKEGKKYIYKEKGGNPKYQGPQSDEERLARAKLDYEIKQTKKKYESYKGVQTPEAADAYDDFQSARKKLRKFYNEE